MKNNVPLIVPLMEYPRTTMAEIPPLPVLLWMQPPYNHGWDTPTTRPVVAGPETSDVEPHGCVVVLRVMRHNTNSRTVPNNKEMYTVALQCVYSHRHTYGAHTVLAHCFIGGSTPLSRPSRERGGNLAPYDHIQGKFQIGWALIFSKAEQDTDARFTANAVSATGGP